MSLPGNQLRTITREGLITLLETSGVRNSANKLDLTHLNLCGLNLNGIRFEHVRFSDAKANRPRRIERAELRNCVFLDCCFSGIELLNAAFRGSRFEWCDFRYASFRNVSFTQTKLAECDFYRSTFEGNDVFERATLTYCSLHLTLLAGADVRRDNLHRAIVQEYPEEFKRFLIYFGSLPPDQIEHYAALGRREAAGVYRALSGLWAVKG